MSTLAVLIDYSQKHENILTNDNKEDDAEYGTLIPFLKAAWICLFLEVFAIIHIQVTLKEEVNSKETYIREKTYKHTLGNIIISDGIIETVSIISQFVLFRYLEYETPGGFALSVGSSMFNYVVSFHELMEAADLRTYVLEGQQRK